jgi:predicted RecB family endonuclease
MSTNGVFISYRRADSGEMTDRIYERLAQHFGPEKLFRDLESISLGRDFHVVIDEALAQCQVALVMIGPLWARIKNNAGRIRLKLEGDLVRLEVETALKRNVPVIPVLVSGATIPSARDLPPSLHDLRKHNGLPVRRDPDFPNDIGKLIEGILEHLKPNNPFTKELAEVVQLLARRESVNVVVPNGISQKEVGDEIVRLVRDLAIVNLEDGETAARPGLIEAVLRAFGIKTVVPDRKPADLVVFAKEMKRHSYAQLAILHSDMLGQLQRREEYGADFFHAIKNATTDTRKLGLVLISRVPFSKLLPPDHELSHIAIKTVELRPAT